MLGIWKQRKGDLTLSNSYDTIDPTASKTAINAVSTVEQQSHANDQDEIISFAELPSNTKKSRKRKEIPTISSLIHVIENGSKTSQPEDSPIAANETQTNKSKRKSRGIKVTEIMKQSETQSEGHISALQETNELVDTSGKVIKKKAIKANKVDADVVNNSVTNAPQSPSLAESSLLSVENTVNDGEQIYLGTPSQIEHDIAVTLSSLSKPLNVVVADALRMLDATTDTKGMETAVNPTTTNSKYERLHWKIVPASTGRKSNMLLWKYFCVYDASMNCNDTIICMMCYERKRHMIGAYPKLWEVRIGDSRSTSHLAQHLKHQHRAEYHEYMQAKEIYGTGKPNKTSSKGTSSISEAVERDAEMGLDYGQEAIDGSSAVGSNSSQMPTMSVEEQPKIAEQSKSGNNRVTINHGKLDTQSEDYSVNSSAPLSYADRIIRAYLHWIVEDKIPVVAGHSQHFKTLVKSITRRELGTDLSTLSPLIQQELADAKILLRNALSMCPITIIVDSWTGKHSILHTIYLKYSNP